MKILFIGGNGNISWYCTQKAIDAGHEVYELNRGATLNTRRDIQHEVKRLICDVRNKVAMTSLLKNQEFDVVCDFICFNSEHAKLDIELFFGRVKQFVFISSTSVYQRKTQFLPFCETTPQWDGNEFEYASGKVEAEKVFISAYENNGFPVTIVRPAYTYDTIVPCSVGHNCFTAPQRWLNGSPVLIAGDGTNLYTFTHARDFAAAFVGLLGNSHAKGEDFHITTDEWLTWLDMKHYLLGALGIQNSRISHIPMDKVLSMEPPKSGNLSVTFMGQNFAHDRMFCAVYDNSKIRKYVPGWKSAVKFEDGIFETIQWLNEKPSRKRINTSLDSWLASLEEEFT